MHKQIRNKILLSASLSAIACVSYGEIQLDSYGALALGVDSEIKYDSNIQLNNSENSDFIGTVLPKVLYRKNEGTLSIDAFVGLELKKYYDESRYDSENFKSGITLFYPNEEGYDNFELEFTGGYNETTEAASDLQAIISRDSTDFDLKGTFYFIDRYYIKTGAEYHKSNVSTAGFNDTDSFVIPIEIFYEYNDSLDLGFGYEYSETDVSGGVPSTGSSDQFVYLAGKGQLLPSVEGTLRVGLQMRDYDSDLLDDTNVFYLEVMLTWDWRSTTEISLKTGNELYTTVANDSIEHRYISVEVREKFDDKISAYVEAGYREHNFDISTRKDEQVFGALGVDYSLIEDRLSLKGRTSYLTQNSNFANAEYDQTVVSLGLSFIY